MQSISITLLGTAHCHLCEEAECVLQTVLNSEAFNQRNIVPQKVDVMDDENLYEQYGIKIPVVLLTLKQDLVVELYWPFDTKDLFSFLCQHLHM